MPPAACIGKEVTVPSLRRRASVIDASHVDQPPQDSDRTTDPAQARALAEEADAEAAAAEAIAAAARASARALKLRRLAEAAEATATGSAAETTQVADATADVDTTEVTESKRAPDSEPDTAHDEAVTVDETYDAVEPSEEKPAKARRRWLPRPNWNRLGAVVVALCAGALLVASGHMLWQHRRAVHEQQLKAEYVAAGRQSVVTLMSLDFNKAQEDVNRILDNSTGEFRDDFKNQAAIFAKEAQDSRVVAEVTVDFAAVESMTKDSATVLVAATSRVTNATGAKQEPRSWRLSVNLLRDGGRVKMAKVEFVT
jgi:Mce-associated membrane protein